MNYIILVFIFSIGIIIAGIFFAIAYINFRKSKKYTGKVYGKVINNIQIKSRDETGENYNRYYWHALCEYYVEGEKCVRQTTSGSLFQKYEIGQSVEICYNPNNCHESYIVGDTDPKVMGKVLSILGVIVLIFITVITIFFRDF